MRNILLTLALALFVITISAHYTVYDVSDGVIVERGSQSLKATKGIELKASDLVSIPQGGHIEVYNELDKQIYRSVKSGKISVNKLMIEARGLAANNRANVGGRLNFGKKGGQDSDTRIYSETGMVRRSLAAYDPDGDGVQMDSKTLGRWLARKVRAGLAPDSASVPVSVKHERISEGGMKFHVENSLQYPIYFNIIKLDASKRQPAVSPLGQPAGSYVLLPRQTMAREHFDSVPADEAHILIMTPCQYDLDAVIEEMGKSLQDDSDMLKADSSLPIHIVVI